MYMATALKIVSSENFLQCILNDLARYSANRFLPPNCLAFVLSRLSNFMFAKDLAIDRSEVGEQLGRFGARHGGFVWHRLAWGIALC